MRLVPVWRIHAHNSLTEREAYRYLAPLVLIRIEPLELFELVIDMRWHLQADRLKGRPVSSFEALDIEFELRVGHQLSVRGSVLECDELFCFFLHGEVIREHTLHLIHLLHATRDFQSCN